MAHGWDVWNQWCDNSTINYTAQPYYTSAGTSVQMQVYPAMVAVPAPAPEPEDDTPLAWLRSQVAEITELATAA